MAMVGLLHTKPMIERLRTRLRRLARLVGRWAGRLVSRFRGSTAKLLGTWWMLVTLAAVAAALWGMTAYLSRGIDDITAATEKVKARTEATRTGLAAAAGVGAAATLLLAFRRQQHTEHSTTETQITELYTKAVEQLGSEKAPVRLGGLYALERVGQGNPCQRQTIVDVVCAYLRMPYPPSETDQRAAEEERHVRLTAQGLLSRHLGQHPHGTHWRNMRVDLSGARLVNLSLERCQIGRADFEGAIFEGYTFFMDTSFGLWANFSNAVFTSVAAFDRVTFNGPSQWDDTNFQGGASFRGSIFKEAAFFSGATSQGLIRFDEAKV
jgi:hypothetical protein